MRDGLHLGPDDPDPVPTGPETPLLPARVLAVALILVLLVAPGGLVFAGSGGSSPVAPTNAPRLTLDPERIEVDVIRLQLDVPPTTDGVVDGPDGVDPLGATCQGPKGDRVGSPAHVQDVSCNAGETGYCWTACYMRPGKRLIGVGCTQSDDGRTISCLCYRDGNDNPMCHVCTGPAY